MDTREYDHHGVIMERVNSLRIALMLHIMETMQRSLRSSIFVDPCQFGLNLHLSVVAAQVTCDLDLFRYI